MAAMVVPSTVYIRMPVWSRKSTPLALVDVLSYTRRDSKEATLVRIKSHLPPNGSVNGPAWSPW